MALIRCPECNKKVSETANSCPKCGWQITPEKVARIKDREKTVEKATGLGCSVILLVILAMMVFHPAGNDNEKVKQQQAINIVQQFYTPGDYLQSLLAGQNWRDESDWFAVRWPYGVSDEMKSAGMTDNWKVIYNASVMDGVEEKTIEATWGVDLSTKAHSALNTTAKTLFVGF